MGLEGKSLARITRAACLVLTLGLPRIVEKSS
jgi:hypothetical protein